MYQDHVPIISRAMRDNVTEFKLGCMFAVCSIRQHVIETNAAKLYAYRDASPRKLIHELTRVPGLGIVKAGFVGQMLAHDVGCLDGRNVKRMSLAPRAYRSDSERRKAGPAWTRKIDRYLSEVEGRACEDVAHTYHKTAEEISALHLCVAHVSLEEIF